MPIIVTIKPIASEFKILFASLILLLILASRLVADSVSERIPSLLSGNKLSKNRFISSLDIGTEWLTVSKIPKIVATPPYAENQAKSFFIIDTKIEITQKIDSKLKTRYFLVTIKLNKTKILGTLTFNIKTPSNAYLLHFK